MHSNVGGGYPDHTLSYVQSKWIAEQAEHQGLVFVNELIDHHTKKADLLGRFYDSRSGLKGYYRSTDPR